MPRFYSLASGSRDGFVEIVVKKHPGGLCSGQLMALEPGDTVSAFLRRNPGFQAGPGPRAADPDRGGNRHRAARRLRARQCAAPARSICSSGCAIPTATSSTARSSPSWQAEGRLARLVTAVSRGARPHYVQDALRAEAAQVARLIRDGARVMVCGGRDMAAGVADALAEILAPAGLTPAMLKAEGRYVEDVY